MVLQTAKGYPQAQLLGPCEVALFHKTADWLRQNIGLKFIQQTEYDGTIDWQFEFGSAILLLRYNPVAGILLCPAALDEATEQDKTAFKKLLETLKSE